MIKKLIAITLALALLPAIAACGGMPKNAVVTVKGQVITLEDVDDRLELEVTQSGMQLPATDTAEYKELQQQVIELLIADKIFALEAEERGIAVTDEDVDEVIQQMKDQVGGEDVFDKQLETAGLTIDRLMEQVRNNLLFREVNAAVIKDAPQVPEEEVRKYYDEHIDEFTNPTETRQVKHILVATEEEANQVIARLNGGEDFAALAAELSLDSGTAATGGSLPQPVPTVNSGLVPEFEQAMAQLGAGEMSGPVKSQYGYHIIVVEKIIPPGPEPYDSVRERLRQQIQTLTYDYDYFSKWFEDAKVKYEVEYAEDFKPRDETGTGTSTTPADAAPAAAEPAPAQ
ncbi:MAG: hypothetical protein C4534_03365 [Gaiellales bacterium]|nr:MAG: hypothetical protein C4534_03365 [Gaiellales bacterium]